MSEHVCPACQGQPAKPVLAHFNTGADSSKHYWAEVTMPCGVCTGTGFVSGWVLLRYHKGRKHFADRQQRGETLFACAQRIGVTPAQLSAFEKGYKDLPVGADSAGMDKP